MTVDQLTANVSVDIADDLSGIAGLDAGMRQVAAGLQRWVEETRGPGTDTGSLFKREKYASTDRIFDQMRIARQALTDDDVVSGLAELTEGLAFQGLAWEAKDWDTQDLFNQMAAEQDLDSLVRTIWREEGAVSTVTLAYWWDYGEFTVRGETSKGNKRKGTKRVYFPRLITVLDPTRIVPVGLLAFGQERLAWRASSQEMALFRMYQQGEYEDDIFDRFYVDRYQVTSTEEQVALAAMGVDMNNLILLNSQNVFRHTITRSDFERFAPVRLKSIFRLLDLKQQLIEADRVSLVGAANYILLVKKGDKDNPAHPEEITNLKANYHTLAKVPVIFSDHRLSVEIVSPKQDFTLQREKYDVIDGRISSRLLSGIGNTSRGGRSQDQAMMLGRPVARAMETRRHMIRRFLERTIAKAVVDHPENKGIFDVIPSLAYSPPNIVLEDSASIDQAVLSLRTQRELSRESVLEHFGFDQQVEAMRRQLEEEKYDDVFKTQVPFSAAGPMGGEGSDSAAGGGQGAPPAAQGPAGAQGGRPRGGGQRPQNPTKTAVTPSGTSQRSE